MGNVDFLLQGWFLKIRHLLSNFFATSAPRAQGGRGLKFWRKKIKQPTRTQNSIIWGASLDQKVSLKKIKANSVFISPPTQLHLGRGVVEKKF